MNNNIYETPTYRDILASVLHKKVLKRFNTKKYHHHTLSGLVKTLTNIVCYSNLNRRYHENYPNRCVGYHIYSSDLTLLKRNKIGHTDDFFTRAEGSTYHANNSNTSESNGYSHWYVYSDLINSAIQSAIYLTVRKLRYNKRFGDYQNLHGKKIMWALDNKCDGEGDFLKINMRRFLFLYKQFKEGLCDDFLKLLYNSAGSDQHYVYVKNGVISSSLDGYGREYTLLGTLSKNTRRFILSGYTEIDLNCGIQSVLANLYYFNTIKQRTETSFKTLETDFTAHYNFLTDKKRFRQKVAHAFKCDEKMAKEILTSISYSPKSRIIYKYCKARIYRVKNLPYDFEFATKQIKKCKEIITPLINETLLMRKSVLEKFYYQEKDSNPTMKLGDVKVVDFKPLIDEDIRLHNKKLKGKGKGKSLEDRRIFRIYEIVEHQIRTQMIEYLHKSGINECHQLHDCLIFKGEVDCQYLKYHIYKSLNLIVHFSEETY